MPNFTRRHYEAVAEVFRTVAFRDSTPAPNFGTLNLLRNEFVRAFAQDNPRFDTKRFEAATATRPNKS
jgi:hypothetical protein